MISVFFGPRLARSTLLAPITVAALLAWSATTLQLPAHAQTAPASAPAAEAPAAAGTNAKAGTGQEFPADAQVLSASELDARLRGKVYTATLANGVGWRADYKNSGYVFVNTTNGGSDTGQWRTENGKVCVQYRGRFPSGCTEMRGGAQALYAKSNANGVVTVLQPE